MSETINLPTLDEAGFGRLYEERIEPCFDRYEIERSEAVKAFQQRVWIGGAVFDRRAVHHGRFRA